MKRLIAILFLVVSLVTIATIEQIYVKNFVNNLAIKSEQVSTTINQDTKNLTRTEVEQSFKNLQEFWENSKIKLCYLTNYEKIKNIDESFIKLSTAIKNNDTSLAIENIAVIKEYSKLFNFFMGFNLNNLF